MTMISQEMQDRIRSVKERIEKLIEQGHLEEAKAAIGKLEENMPGDQDICSMRAVIHILEGDADKAEEVLLDGLKNDSVHFDLLYNLAYIYEQRGQFREAMELYCKAGTVADASQLANVGEAIARLKLADSSIEPVEKDRIVFFCRPGLDNFLGDIIQGLSEDYFVRKMIVSDFSQIDKGMEWADVCWFEWCDELVIYGSSLPLARVKKIICRLHRYEVFTGYPGKVTWENVDKLVIVTRHLEDIIRTNWPDIPDRVEITVIENGVDIGRYAFKERSKGFNLAMVGYIHSRKNPVLALQVMKKLVDIDKRYKLYVAGTFQEQPVQMYWDYQVRRMGLDGNVIFEGWQKDISSWLEDKNYLISASIHESFGYAIAEAMARGIKPVIHDFLHADEIWPEEYLFNTVDEAVGAILSDDYDSHRYRDFIVKNYPLEKQLDKTRKLVNDLLLKTKQYSNFSPYSSGYIDRFDFSDAAVSIGKKELISPCYQSVSFILKNCTGKRLVITDIVHNRRNNSLELPEYIRTSKYCGNIVRYCREILSDPGISFNEHGIAGFVYDDQLAEDIKRNRSAYIWERGIPATEFMPDAAFSNILDKYRFASGYISDNFSVLEAASGFGYGAAYLSGRPGCVKITALDISEENIRFGKSCYDFDNIEWIQGDVTKLPLNSSTYDIYTSFETMEHLPVDLVGAYFSEALRVLKNGGKMILSTPNKKARAHINNPYHIKEYTFEELDEILRSYFDSIEYYSCMSDIRHGVDESAPGFIAVCRK